MENQSFSLLKIMQEIYKKRVWILLITLAALIISTVCCLMRPPKYTSQTTFLVKNLLLIDRNYIFKNNSFDNGQFFAVPDDIDNIKTIAKSKSIFQKVIDSFDLHKVYEIKDRDRLVEVVKSNFKFVMEDTKSVELYYTDKNPQRAAHIVNALRENIESAFLNYFISTNKDIMVALQHETNLLDDSIATLNDSMKHIRFRINNYSELLPTRGAYIATGNRKSTMEDVIELEKIQELAYIKERLASDVAQHKSLINEYREMLENKIHAFYVVQNGDIPSMPSGPGIIIIVSAGTIAALFFACILVLAGTFLRERIPL